MFLATGCDGLGSTGSLSHFIYMFIHLYAWFCAKNKFFFFFTHWLQCNLALNTFRRLIQRHLHHRFKFINSMLHSVWLITWDWPMITTQLDKDEMCGSVSHCLLTMAQMFSSSGTYFGIRWKSVAINMTEFRAAAKFWSG